MSQNALPSFQQSLSQSGITNKAWYAFFQGLWKGLPPSSVTSIALTASPMTYTTAQRGFVMIQGSAVSMVQFTRDNVNNYVTGQTQGCFPLSSGDSLIIAYTGTPALTFVPQ